MNAPAKMLLIYVDETDTWGSGRLYEAIVRRLRQLGVAGATVHTGIMGFGSHQNVHHRRLFGITDDKPVTITVVDSEGVIREVLPEIQAMVKEGLLVLLDAEVFEPTTPRESS
jgi:PII-like signaling protein